jgi:ribosomal protein S18 acetylase RimI-like enzyme
MSQLSEEKNEAPEDFDDSHPNYTISDFTVKSVSDNVSRIGDVNAFFNSPDIKSELHWFTHRDTLERAVDRSDRRLYYFSPFDKILGALMVWCESRVLDEGQAQIRLVAVDPLYRGFGIGEYLVKEAIDFAREKSKTSMIADVAGESPAVDFWLSCGFEKVDEYETDGGRVMFRMKQSISE